MDKKKINLVVMILVGVLFLFTNIYAVRKIMNYGTEVFFYDKMLTAYEFGSETGMRQELDKLIALDNKGPILKLAQIFKSKLAGINDPGEFLKVAVAKRVNELKVLRQMRNLGFMLVLGLFLFRLIFNHSLKVKK